MKTPLGNAIETIGLNMVYRSGKMDVPAVQDVNISVKNGEFIAIMGPSGCGKTTLLHLLGGLLQPTGGKILIDGINIASLTDVERTSVRRKKIGYVFQRFNLLPTLTARGNIELAKKIHNNGNEHPLGASRIFEMLGLSGKENSRPLELSGGEQQRVAIARAVINSPSIILADEPTGNLDSKNSRMVLEMLRNLNETLGQSIVMITHDADAASIADRVIEMKDGRVLGPKSQFSFKLELESFY
jgi:putative ABC transport system ATP-binding protein